MAVVSGVGSGVDSSVGDGVVISVAPGVGVDSGVRDGSGVSVSVIVSSSVGSREAEGVGLGVKVADSMLFFSNRFLSSSSVMQVLPKHNSSVNSLFTLNNPFSKTISNKDWI